MQFCFKCVKVNSLHGSYTENGNVYGAHSEPTQVVFCMIKSFHVRLKKSLKFYISNW